ncbi:MAG: hypothetical protein QOJ13_27 [Gaiellales bacterium]|jgi:hypothetical protein|nr:hypothetical protein [Gaiellales bacterium]
MGSAITYCVIPTDTSPTDVAALRLRFADDPSVCVILDDRAGEEQPTSETLKQRRPVLRWDVPETTIPGARFEQHMPPVDLSMADLPDAVIIARSIEHDVAASAELRWRYYARVLILLSNRLGNRTRAHELVPATMDAVQRALPDLPPGSDFSRWLAAFVAGMPLDA